MRRLPLHPGCFWQRVCKPLGISESTFDSLQRMSKEPKSVLNHDRTSTEMTPNCMSFQNCFSLRGNVEGDDALVDDAAAFARDQELISSGLGAGRQRNAQRQTVVWRKGENRRV